MLSKILSANDASRARAAVYSSIGIDELATQPKSAADIGENSRFRDENQQLHQQIRQLEAGLAAAKRDSFEAGRREGDMHSRAEVSPILERLAVSLEQLSDLRQEIRRRAENDMVQLALLIARRVLHRELSTDSNALAALARVVFDRMARSEKLRVSVHPNFAPAVTGALSQRRAAHIQIDPDPACALGSFVVRSEDGILDASVDTQLEEISRGLTDRLNGRT
jgi:flagellar assembly protein FliH